MGIGNPCIGSWIYGWEIVGCEDRSDYRCRWSLGGHILGDTEWEIRVEGFWCQKNDWQLGQGDEKKVRWGREETRGEWMGVLRELEVRLTALWQVDSWLWVGHSSINSKCNARVRDDRGAGTCRCLESSLGDTHASVTWSTVCIEGWQTSSVKGQIIRILSFVWLWVLHNKWSGLCSRTSVLTRLGGGLEFWPPDYESVHVEFALEHVPCGPVTQSPVEH